jgi:DNA-binding MarR family transcriptional regulator
MAQKASIFDSNAFSFGRKFGLLGRLFHAQLSDRLKHIGIKKHFSILVLIDNMGNQCSQKFIADALHIDKTLMVGALDELGQIGFIKRVQNPTDRREYWIQLTEKGMAAIPEVKKTVATMNEAALAGLSPLEIKRFHKYLGVVYKNLENSPAT